MNSLWYEIKLLAKWYWYNKDINKILAIKLEEKTITDQDTVIYFLLVEEWSTQKTRHRLDLFYKLFKGIDIEAFKNV